MKRDNVKISVIIPVYNIDQYLDKCLSSIISQTLKEIEIIVVNDGSHDNSIGVIRSYESKDERITVIDKINDGVVAARRSGLAVACGEYIHYLDGDDYMEPNSYELLYKKAVASMADMVMFEFNKVRGNLAQFDIVDNDMSGQEFIHYSLRKKVYFSLGTHIHKRALYENPIIYYNDLTIGEDFITTQQLAHYSKKVSFLHLPLYNYVSRPSSAMMAAITPQKAKDFLRHIDILLEFYANRKGYEELEKYLYILSLDSVGHLFWRRSFYNAKEISKEALRKIQKYPDLRYTPSIKRVYKLVRIYAISTLLGRIYAQYYIMKGKLK